MNFLSPRGAWSGCENQYALTTSRNYSQTMWNRVELKSDLCGFINMLLKISEEVESCSSEYNRKTQQYCGVCSGLLWWRFTEIGYKIFACVCMSIFGGRSSFNYLLKVIPGFPKFNTVSPVLALLNTCHMPACPTFISGNPQNTRWKQSPLLSPFYKWRRKWRPRDITRLTQGY